MFGAGSDEQNAAARLSPQGNFCIRPCGDVVSLSTVDRSQATDTGSRLMT